MHEAVTVGMVVWTGVAILGACVVLGAIVWVLSLFADAWKH